MAFIYELQSESHLQVFGFIGIGGSLKFVLPGTRDIGGGPIHTRAKSVGVIILYQSQWTVAFYLNKAFDALLIDFEEVMALGYSVKQKCIGTQLMKKSYSFHN